MIQAVTGRTTRSFREAPVHLADLTSVGARISSTCSEVVRMLLDGRIECAGLLRGKRGLGAVLINWAEAKKALPKSSRKCLTLVELASELQVGFYTAQMLVERGYIGTAEWSDPYRKATRATYVSIDEVKRFTAEYVPAQEMAQANGTHVRVLVPKLRDLGLPPSISNREVGMYFYRRQDISTAVQLIRQASGKSDRKPRGRSNGSVDGRSSPRPRPETQT